ncbi:sulfiredoxin-1-like [Styela clava]|uniref:sulfiredoxin-1-like n=1 Tax=Styela clava TaxID=7725 RepID=UPI0019397951|nr:sulfiredoxin-1-like [Styela clava]
MTKRTFAQINYNPCFQFGAHQAAEIDYSTVMSIHGDHINEVHNIPIEELIQPFHSSIDESKVKSLMQTIQDHIDDVPPIDVIWIKGRLGGNYYYCFGGCHRLEAHKRLIKGTIRAKLIKANIAALKVFLGSSTPDLK